jgi:hypothetical protein
MNTEYGAIPSLAEPCERQNPIENFAQYEINIRPLNSGYLVGVGCQSFAFENKERMMKMIQAFLNDPQKVGENWRKNQQLPNVE